MGGLKTVQARAGEPSQRFVLLIHCTEKSRHSTKNNKTLAGSNSQSRLCVTLCMSHTLAAPSAVEKQPRWVVVLPP